ncbi:MAG: DUF3857 domain-containing protein [Hyphomicrobiales bacterium]|nr:DUF3857 domain-containing protein [Hyphomicrobiales bacterium]
MSVQGFAGGRRASVLGFCMLASALLNGPARAQAPASDAPFSTTYQIDYTIHADHRISARARYVRHVNLPVDVQSAGTYRISHNEHFTASRIVEAFTRKADGRVIPVSPDKILVQAATANTEALYFYVDMKTTTVIFPDVAAGDTVEAVVEQESRRPYFANGAEGRWVFPRFFRVANATITVKAPVESPLHVEARGFASEARQDGGQRLHIFRYQPAPYGAVQTDAVDLQDYEPALFVSTFPDWHAVARTFWDEGASKSDPTPEIAALARKITAGLSGPREKTEAIFHWVANNIRYVALVLGPGGFVPHDATSILANRYGDCKDHVTLMRAMLRSLEIRADYALVNAAGRYRASAHPSASFDHIILYLPDFDLYVDPTVSNSAFGHLEPRLAGKPVLRFDGVRADYTRIPEISPDQHRRILNANITIRPDGTATGRNTVESFGSAISEARMRVAVAERQGLADFANKSLTSTNWKGTATLDISGVRERGNAVSVASTFQLTDNLLAARNGMRIPTGPRLSPRPFARLNNLLRQHPDRPFTCLPVRHEERIVLDLPESAPVPELPRNLTVERGKSAYKASYRLEGRSVLVERSFTWDAGKTVCEWADLEAMQPVIQAAMRDVSRARLRFQKGPANDAGDDGNDVE